MNGLHAQFRLPLGGFTLNAAFEAPASGVTCVLGPSGCGKTTLLRCVAGLTRAPAGLFSINGETWQDESQHVFAPTHRRAVAYVFQEPSLFDHLDVRRNIEYGLRRIPHAQRHIEFGDVVEWLGVGPLLARAPLRLSGGEKQRVAIARALVTSPKLLLMDEPLSALDEASREEILPYLARLHEALAIPMLYVSHNLREVARLADYLLRMEGGRITEAGPAAELLESGDRSASTAGGESGFLTLTVLDHDDRYHLTRAASAFGTLWLPRLAREPGAQVRVHIGARDVSVALGHDHQSSILNQLAARVTATETHGPGQVLLVLAPKHSDNGPKLFALITRKSFEELGLAPERIVVARIKGVNVTP
jgi:molybdate transport system ATP-binding protein